MASTNPPATGNPTTTSTTPKAVVKKPSAIVFAVIFVVLVILILSQGQGCSSSRSSDTSSGRSKDRNWEFQGNQKILTLDEDNDGWIPVTDNYFNRTGLKYLDAVGYWRIGGGPKVNFGGEYGKPDLPEGKDLPDGDPAEIYFEIKSGHMQVVLFNQ